MTTMSEGKHKMIFPAQRMIVVVAVCTWTGYVAYLRWRRQRFVQSNAEAALAASVSEDIFDANKDIERKQSPPTFTSGPSLNNGIGASTWRVHHLLTSTELFFEAWLAMSSRGLFATYAIPSISSVLHHTGGFGKDMERRYADMELLIREFNENAVDGTVDFCGQPGRATLALHRLNAIHQEYAHLITYKDMVYVLSVFAVAPSSWFATRWSWRNITEAERECVYRHWCNIGQLMGLDITMHFRNWEEMRDYKRAYEQKYMHFSPSNQLVVYATIEFFIRGVIPSCLRNMARPVVLQLMSSLQESPKHAEALGLPNAHPVIATLVDIVLSVRAVLCRYFLPPRPLSRTHRLTGRTCTKINDMQDSLFGGHACPFGASYRPLRPLDFNNKTYTPEGVSGNSYQIENMGPRQIPPGMVCPNPSYLGHKEKKII